ncbi:MAG: carbohydrate ABC transporter permease, partial [Oscillospiraceae bacterium]
MSLKESLGRKAFLLTNGLLLIIIGCITIYPLLYVTFASFSDANTLMAFDGVLLYPLKPNIEAYKAVFKNSFILTGYINKIM